MKSPYSFSLDRTCDFAGVSLYKGVSVQLDGFCGQYGSYGIPETYSL